MLILTRTPNQVINIGDDIQVEILGIKGNQVRIGISAPRSTPVHRHEVYKRIQRENNSSGEEKVYGQWRDNEVNHNR